MWRRHNKVEINDLIKQIRKDMGLSQKKNLPKGFMSAFRQLTDGKMRM